MKIYILFMVSQQTPIDSPFGYRSTALEVIKGIDLTGTTGVVTGGYSGIGSETVRALIRTGMNVIVGARRPDIAKANLSNLGDLITILPLDLLKQSSIEGFVKNVKSQINSLELLVNNAAIMANPLTRDDRGYESQFATNHLGHFHLTARLWSLLASAESARVVVLSSIAHRRNGLDLNDLNFEKRTYDKWIAYAQSKTANALFALSLDKLGEPKEVRAFAVHPGGISTRLQRHLSMDEQKEMGWYDENGKLHQMFKTPQEGASTTVWCATSPLLEGYGGVYCEDCNIAKPFNETTPYHGVLPHVRDEKLAEELWIKSEELTGVRFPNESN